MVHYQPHADVLVLVSQVGATVEVEGVDGVGVGTEVVLGAAFGGKILVVAAVLGDLEMVTLGNLLV